MYEFGAIAIIGENNLEKYSVELELMNDNYDINALKAMNLTINDLKNRDNLVSPKLAMLSFENWINELLTKHNKKRAVFLSDNLAFDWQWINFYFHYFLERNPFGFSGRRIGDIFSGLSSNISDHSSWKKQRITKHDHKSINDALGNAEAFLYFLMKY